MLKMAPPPSKSRTVEIVAGTWIVGVYFVILIALGMEFHNDFVTYKPGVARIDPRMATPEAQRQLFSLR